MRRGAAPRSPRLRGRRGPGRGAEIAERPQKSGERNEHAGPERPHHAPIVRRHAIVQAEDGGDGTHQQRQRRKKGDVALALERVVPVVAIERHTGVPPCIEAGGKIRERILRWGKSRLRLNPERHHRKESNEEHRRPGREERATGSGEIGVATDPVTNRGDVIEQARARSQQVPDDHNGHGRVDEWERRSHRHHDAEHQVPVASEQRDPQGDSAERERGDVREPQRQRRPVIVWSVRLCRHSDP